jgi:hypothetical protein
VENEPTIYYLDRPGAWGQFGLGLLLLVVPLALMIAFSIPGVFVTLFPDAPRERRDPLAMALLAAVAIGGMGAGIYFLHRAVRTLRDRAPKLEFTSTGLVDHRGQQAIAWQDVVGWGLETRVVGSRVRRAVLTLTLREGAGARGVEIDLRELSQPPESIFAQVNKVAGLA